MKLSPTRNFVHYIEH